MIRIIEEYSADDFGESMLTSTETLTQLEMHAFF